MRKLLNWKYAIIFMLLCVVAYFVFVKWCVTLQSEGRAYYHDQLIFELIGKDWSNGIVAYTHYLDHKGPIVFLYFCLGYFIGGGNIIGLSILSMIWMILTVILTYIFLIRCSKTVDFIGQFVSFMLSLLITLFIRFWTFYDGITVGFIVFPFLLICVILLQQGLYIKNDDHRVSFRFSLTNKCHFLYGLCCGCVVLARASDAIFVFCIYALIWLYSFFVDKGNRIKYLINLGSVFLGGFLIYGLFAMYFLYHNVFDVFMNCTFWYNFQYAPPNDANSSFLYVILAFAVFVILTISFFTSHNDDKVSLPFFILVLCSVFVHIVFLFKGAIYRQYLICYVVDFMFMVYMLGHFQYRIIHCVMSVLSCICFLTVFLILYLSFANIKDDYMLYLNELKQICNEDISSGKSCVVLDNADLTGVLFDEGYHFDCIRPMFQSWHVDCSVTSESDMANAIHSSDPDMIYTMGDVKYQLFLDGYYLSNVYESKYDELKLCVYEKCK